MKEKKIKLKKDKRGNVGYAQPRSWLERMEMLKDKPYLITLGLAGVLLMGIGVISAGMIANKMVESGVEEIVEMEKEEEGDGEVFVDVAGAVIQPGLYQLSEGGRINDALVAAGGLSENADRDWFSKNINLAQKLTDGVKIYVLSLGEIVKSDGQAAGQVSGAAVTDKININTASAAELDRLWGVGPATAEKIIGGRPYGSVEELLTRKIVNSNVYERCKDKVSVY